MKLRPLTCVFLSLMGHMAMEKGISAAVVIDEDLETGADDDGDDGEHKHGPRRAAHTVHAALESLSSIVTGGGSDGCMQLELEDDLVYSQLEAEASNNDLLSAAYGIINSKLDGITSMTIDYRGEGINRQVGKFTASAKITRITAAGQEVEQCYSIPYEIQDTDECNLPEGEPMRHKCHPSTVCINTLGSYECGCAEGYWGEENSGSPSLDKPIKSEEGECGGENSTEACCGRFGSRVERRAACREDFKCTSDPCKGHTCDENAWCSAGEGYKGYECTCKDGFKKDDRGDCVRDVRVAVNYCKNNTCPYHCRCSVEGEGYRCQPRPGYKAFTDPAHPPSDYYANGSSGGRRLDTITRCVDNRVPEITIKGENPMIYKQGDSYVEKGVTVDDVNDDDSERTIKIVYSESRGAYLDKVGQFTVKYVLENRLLDDPLVKTRTVIVLDVDECTYDGPHEQFHHACSVEATCHNTNGGYECVCASGYSGDGMTTGTGCTDVTPPFISCVGAGCEVSKFRACNCVGMVSEDGSKQNLPDALTIEDIEANLKLLKADICGDKDSSALEEFTPEGDDWDDREWKPEACFEAIDMEFGGKVVDLTRNITKGPLEKIPGQPNMWRVPHYVKDRAGNAASPYYFNIKVEEVDVLSTVRGTVETLERGSAERRNLWMAIIVLATILLFPLLWRVLVFLRTVFAAAKVVFFPYSMVGSRDDFKLGYGFLLRVKAMGMGNNIERERKIAAYWARLMDEANAYDYDDVHDDD